MSSSPLTSIFTGINRHIRFKINRHDIVDLIVLTYLRAGQRFCVVVIGVNVVHTVRRYIAMISKLENYQYVVCATNRAGQICVILRFERLSSISSTRKKIIWVICSIT